MKISTKGRYALRMLLDLAEHRSEQYVTLKEIAERQNISKQYLEQIVSILNGSNILRSTRGKKGGYMLAKDPSQCSIAWILRITEGSLAPIACLDDDTNQCERAEYCQTLPMWVGLNKVITDYLESISLEDLLQQSQKGYIDNYMI